MPEASLRPFIVSELKLDITQRLPGHRLGGICSDRTQRLRFRQLEVSLGLINRRQIDRRQ